MDFEVLRKFLESSGYAVSFRRDVWVECWLVQGTESWLGRGLDESLALQAAVALAFPSTLARNLLTRMLNESLQEQPVEPELEAPEPATEEEAPRLVVKPLPRAKSTPPPLVPKELPTREDLPQALDALTLLKERIRDSREELGLSSPDRQRLAMLAWICEARSYTDLFPDDPRVRDDVALISRQLTEIGKAYWPGSVTALQLQMQPRDLPKHLLGGVAASWGRAAELAERALTAHEYLDERRGFDQYGWADAAALLPGPTDPARMLALLAEEIEQLGGPLDRCLMPREPDVRPNPQRFLDWVRRVRWLRGTAVDAETWARVAGRLRWWGSRRDPAMAQALRELDSSFTPGRPWAAELGLEGGDLAPPAVPSTLVERVRAGVGGKKMAFVGHRRDPDLQRRLGEMLAPAMIDWHILEHKRLVELEAAILERRFEVVLGALGLQAHQTDRILARACRLAGVRYVRVNRGRPLVCARNLARQLTC